MHLRKWCAPCAACCAAGILFALSANAGQPVDKSDQVLPVSKSQLLVDGQGGIAGADCPGSVLSADPPSGTVDARQPHVLNDPSTLQGIGGPGEPITIDLGEAGAPEGGFCLCETAEDPSGANSIASVTDNGDGTYTLELARPITANAVTTITYAGGGVVSYTSHPANANGDSTAGASDVLVVVDIINGTPPVHGIYSSDIDHSGVVGGPDVLRTIDLLNGAAGFPVQLLTGLPDGSVCDGAPCDCPSAGEEFVAYQSVSPSGFYYGVDADICPNGLGDCGDGIVPGPETECETNADDIEVIVDSCTLTRITVPGFSANPYDVELEVWTNDDAGTPEDPTDDIPGEVIANGGCFNAAGGGTELAEFTFDGAILPKNFWVVLQDNQGLAGPLISGDLSEVGNSRDSFAIIEEDGTWNPNVFFGGCEGGLCGSFQMTVYCEGVAPTGACCVDQDLVCVDDQTATECATLNGRWSIDATCADMGFDPQCGTGACCQTGGVCENLSADDCAAAGGAIFAGDFCEDEGFSCINDACINAEGSCFEANGSPGCDDADCCNTVCNIDPFCCDFEWDGTCAGSADNFCLPNDDCEEALEAFDGCTEFTNNGATMDGPGDCLNGDAAVGGADVWYQYTATCTGTLTVAACVDNGCSPDTLYDNTMQVYAGCDCNLSNQLDCQDDSCIPGEFGIPAVVSTEVTEGECITIRVGGWNGEMGDGSFSITCE